MATRSVNAETTGTLSERGLSQAEVLNLILINNDLGNLQTAVQALIETNLNQRLPTSLSDLGGVISASRVIFADTLNGEQEIAAVKGLIGSPASAPILTGPPTITVQGGGSAVVGATLQANPGPVTNGSSGSHTDVWDWCTLDANGNPVSTGQTGATFFVAIQYLAARLVLKQRPVGGGNDGAGNTLTSSVIGPITAVLPTTAGSPTLAPSGSQTAGVVLTPTPPTYTNGTSFTYLYQYYSDGVAFGDLQGALQTDNSMKGKAITTRSQATNQLGVKSALSAPSAAVNIAGSVYAASVLPNLSAVVREGSNDPITGATWPTTLDGNPISVTVQRREILYDGDTIVGATLPAAYLFYQPELPGSLPSVLVAAQYAKTADAVIKIREVVLASNGQTYTAVSTTRIVQPATASVVALTLSQAGAAGYQLTTGLDYSLTPAVRANGVGPFSFSISPALPAGYAFSPGNQLPIVVNTSAVQASTPYTLTVTDAGNSNATASVQFTIAAANATTTAAKPAFQQAGDYQSPTGSYELEAPGQNTVDGYPSDGYQNGLLIPPLTNMATKTRNSVVRLGPGSLGGIQCVRHEVRPGDPLRNSGHRSELTYVPFLRHGQKWWMGFACNPDPDWTLANMGGSGDRQSIVQVHQEETTFTGGGPFGAIVNGGASLGQEIQWFTESYIGGSETTVTRARSALRSGQWTRYIIEYCSGINAAQNPVLRIYEANQAANSYTLLVDLAPGVVFGDPAQNTTADYPKTGIYKWTSGAYGSTSKRGLWDSPLYVDNSSDGFNKVAQSLVPFAVAGTRST